MSSLTRSATSSMTEFKSGVATVAAVAVVVWAVTVLNWILGGWIGAHAVVPRTTAGLWGIAVMPFVHSGIAHIVANTTAGIPLALMSMERKKLDFFVVSLVSALSSGLGAWLFGAAGSVHIGASGVIFGLMGFLMGRGIFERRPKAILVSIITMLLFGGTLITMLPGVVAGISWQAHLFGFLGGGAVSRILGQKLTGK